MINKGKEQEQMRRERIKELDVLRVIAFIFVVAQHILGGYSLRPDASFTEAMILGLFYVIAKPAVPIFLAVSAITLIHSSQKDFSVITFYKKRFLFIIIPYIIWSALNIIDAKTYTTFFNFLGRLLAGDARYHLWYMSMILRIYLFFPLILAVVNKLKTKGKILNAVLFLLLGLGYLVLLTHQSIISQIELFLFGTPNELEKKFLERTPLLWSFYFIAGLYIAEYYDGFKTLILNNKILILTVYIPLLGYNYYAEMQRRLPGFPPIHYNYANFCVSVSFMLISIVIFYIVSILIAEKTNIIYEWFRTSSQYSYAAYLAHVIILQWTAQHFNLLFHLKNLVISGLCIFIITVFLSIKLNQWISYLPLSRFMIGTREKYHGPFLRKLAQVPALENFHLH